MALTINIHNIRQNKASEIKGILLTDAKDLNLVSEPFTLCGPVECNWTATNAGDLYILAGKIVVCYQVQCSRCLTDVTQTQHISFSEQVGRNHACTATADDELLPVRGDEIDLAPVLREYILLNAPVKPLCASECKGICPQCGQDKNIGDCGCQASIQDPRLLVLQKLLKDD